ncbi:MAG: hemerythrin domain-containing protein [Gammaproteobacteria bacterium]
MANHRQTGCEKRQKLPFGSLGRFVWQDHYRLGDRTIDHEHKDCLDLARHLALSTGWDERLRTDEALVKKVQDHFRGEEAAMERLEIRNAEAHIDEHRFLSEKLSQIKSELQENKWQPNALLEFVDLWNIHTLRYDKCLNAAMQKQKLDRISA